MGEYVSKKISEKGDKVLKYVQAHYQLEKGDKATESEVLELALEHLAEERYGYRKKVAYKWQDMENFVKAGKKSTEKDIDRLVYGV